MMRKKIFFLLLVSGAILFACSDPHPIPKPPTYLKINFPDRVYSRYYDDCGYNYVKPNYFVVKNAGERDSCNRDIHFKTLNGVLLLGRMHVDTTLAALINYANDKVGRHKIKATAIYDSTIIRKKAHVYGTFFELQGNVATPFQFYLTDSVNNFISGAVYFDAVPNYDSIKPVLDFVKKDLYKFIYTLQWDKEK